RTTAARRERIPDRAARFEVRFGRAIATARPAARLPRPPPAERAADSREHVLALEVEVRRDDLIRRPVFLQEELSCYRHRLNFRTTPFDTSDRTAGRSLSRRVRVRSGRAVRSID